MGRPFRAKKGLYALQQKALLLDHLVGALEERLRKHHAK